MESMSSLVGIAVGAIVLVQFGAWTALTVRRMALERRQFEVGRRLLRQKLDLAFDSQSNDDHSGWHGFRDFVVGRIQPESQDCVSIELVPEDGRRLPNYLPGQFITLRLSIPEQLQPVVRCYSLSDAPHEDRFRITVRAIQSRRDGAPVVGVASHFLNHNLVIGDRVEVKAPSGAFTLDLQDRRPAVFLAGGIGITPIMSMLHTLARHQIRREVLLLYGVRNGRHHTFREPLARLASKTPQFKGVTCYSDPLPDDRLGLDYQLAGRVSVKTLRRLVPSTQIPFYVCGPAAFMQSLIADLREWGVADSNIHFEAFGPASIQNGNTDGANRLENANAPATIVFHKSAKTARSGSTNQTILELADTAGVPIPSGCRAGNCGTCQTRLLKGQTAYLGQTPPADCEPGSILACVARPIGDVVVDA